MMIWYGFAFLGIVAFVASRIPARPGKWGSGDASAADVAAIVGGKRPKATPRTLAQFVLILLGVVAMGWVVTR